MVLPLEPTDLLGVYRRASKFVVVHRADGRQRKQTAGTLADARAIKLQRDGEARPPVLAAGVGTNAVTTTDAAAGATTRSTQASNSSDPTDDTGARPGWPSWRWCWAPSAYSRARVAS